MSYRLDPLLFRVARTLTVMVGINMYVAMLINIREGGEIRLFITLVPKVEQYRFLVRWLNNFGDF